MKSQISQAGNVDAENIGHCGGAADDECGAAERDRGQQSRSDGAVRSVWRRLVCIGLGHGRERNWPPRGLARSLYVPTSQGLAGGRCPDANNQGSFWNSPWVSATVILIRGNPIDPA